jgi:hypothetical protein
VNESLLALSYGVYNRINLLNDFFNDLQRWFCKLVGPFHILRPQPGFWKNKMFVLATGARKMKIAQKPFILPPQATTFSHPTTALWTFPQFL